MDSSIELSPSSASVSSENRLSWALAVVVPVILLNNILPEDLVPAFYRSLDCYVLPSRGEGWSLTHQQVAEALDFVKSHQEEDGSWYGRWGVNYIYGTWQVLRGMRALNLDMNADWLQRGRAWLESVQHDDGGWGERCSTYDDPVFKGQGPSTASQTAWAIMGLCAFDEADRPSLRRGIEYLIRTQGADGSWAELETTGTGFPRVYYLKYDMYRNSWPLLALATYRKLLKS